MPRYVLALDQGTTSSRAILFDHAGRPVHIAAREFPQVFPEPGHVEHDPEAIWDSQLAVARQALKQAGAAPDDVAAVGITNQRETTILWQRDTGRPIANAIVWQSRITAPICERLKAEGHDDAVRKKTGLVIDPYFSATKIRFLLDRHAGLRERAERGDVLFGTIDSFLLWRLTGGRVHATDLSNASRTLLFNIHSLDWDDELLAIFGVPRAMLPDVRPSSGTFGTTDAKWLGAELPIAGIAGDQQAATFGQACFRTGMAKNTYGTGAFVVLNTGQHPVESRHGLLATIGWKVGEQLAYCLEGSIFVAGAAVQWLRDGLHAIRSSAEVETLARQVPDSGGVYLVPAFVGLGAPHWDPYARGLIIGLTRGTTIGHVARATVESIAYQTADVLQAMAADSGVAVQDLRVDGGAVVNDSLCQFQADILGVHVTRPQVRETTALGAAYLAGLATGFWRDLAELERNWALERRFEPHMTADRRAQLLASWKRAVERSKGWTRGNDEG